MKQLPVFQKIFEGSKSIRFTAKISAAFCGKSQEMGEYPIVFDPQVEKRTLIIGMFVLRPAYCAWTAPILSHKKNMLSKELYRVEDWAYGYRGIDGGSLVSDCCPFDAFRVALQYGLSDAVIVGTKTVCAEGIDTITRKGDSVSH